LRSLASVASTLLGIGSRENESVQHDFRTSRLDLFRFIEIVQELVRAVALDPPTDILEEP